MEIFLPNNSATIGKFEDPKTIEKKFLKVINSFALKPEWINKKNKLSNGDTIIYFRIKVPKSIKQPILLNEIVSSIENGITSVNCKEESIGGNTTLKIFTNKKQILSAKLIYDESIEREVSKLAFLIYYNSAFSADELREMKSYLPIYHLLIPLNDDAKKVASMAASMNIDYSIMLNDEISSTYEIDEDDSKKSIVSQVKSIIESFPGSKSIVFDPNYSLCSSKIFPFIKSEFKSRGKTLFDKRGFHSMENRGKAEQESLFRYYYVKYAGQDLQNIILPLSDLTALSEEIKIAKLKGHQFLQPVF